MTIHHNQLELIQRVLDRAKQGERADLVLRQELGDRALDPFDKREIAEAVFNYFRWFGWLDGEQLIPIQLDRAAELASHFGRSPQSFADRELRDKAVPKWIHSVADLSPAILRAFQQETHLWLRSAPGKAEDLARKLRRCTPHPKLPLALEFTGSEDLFRSPEFHNGDFEIQDVTSQAVGLICAPIPGETWWDACAGEGGKTLHLASLMQNKGLVWASDRAEWRLKNLKRRAARAHIFNYRIKHWTNPAKAPVKGPFDGVLVDAPCSGVGTWQRNPHARWTTTLKDVEELAVIQLALLNAVAPTVKPGGKLIYSVCTLSRNETEDVAQKFSENHPGFEPLPMINPFTDESAFPCWLRPPETSGIAMYLAAWRRK